ncbi:hypothetical protein WA158_002771 [Blastocystis sp. Blastoise]
MSTININEKTPFKPSLVITQLGSTDSLNDTLGTQAKRSFEGPRDIHLRNIDDDIEAMDSLIVNDSLNRNEIDLEYNDDGSIKMGNYITIDENNIHMKVNDVYIV